MLRKIFFNVVGKWNYKIVGRMAIIIIIIDSSRRRRNTRENFNVLLFEFTEESQ